MKRLMLAWVLVLAMVSQAGAIATTTATLQNAAAGNVNGTSVDVKAFTAATIQVVLSAGAATVTFKGSVDGTNFATMECFSIADRTTSITSVTGSGVWRCNILGLSRIQTPITGCAGCSVTVTAGLVSGGLN